MKKRHRSLSALCLAALLVCLLPANTMLASADGTDPVQEASGGAEPEIEELEAADDAETGLGEEKSDIEGSQGVQEPETGSAEEQEPQATVLSDNHVMEENSAAPVIEIKLEGTDYAQALGGTVNYNKYIDNRDQRFNISVSGADSAVTLSYYLANDGHQESETATQLQSQWSPVLTSYNNEILLNMDAKYVLYVKAEVNGQSYYARTDGVVVDTVAPQIAGVADGGTYQAGTTFTVQDENLDTVMINDEIAAPAGDGSYQVKAKGNSTSCVIKAKDKANHETTVSITVEGGDTDDGDDDGNDNDTNVISESGTYSLRAGIAYRLGSGTWKLSGDSAVYQGERTFYVVSDGEYTFERRK